MAKRIGVLAVQGAFAEHEAMLSSIGAECRELRSAADLEQKPDALVLPGGESTVQRKLLMESGMLAPIKSWIEEGMPVLATCAGLILLAEHLSNDERTCFKTLPVTVRRNAYGRQLGSFITEAEVRTRVAAALNYHTVNNIQRFCIGIDGSLSTNADGRRRTRSTRCLNGLHTGGTSLEGLVERRDHRAFEVGLLK